MTWQDRAACKGFNELFYLKHAAPKCAPICAACPVIDECRKVALYERDGYWAGMSQRARKQERIRLGITIPPDRPTAECGTASGRQRHRNNKERVCDLCAVAYALYEADRRRFAA